MKILLTGGSGFIGSELKKVLESAGHQCYNADLKNSFNIKYLITFIYLFEKYDVDIVIHLAAQTLLRESIKDPLEDAWTNIIGSLNLLEACAEKGIKKVLYTSTGGARYGIQEESISESCTPKPISPYGISKHTVEHYLDFYNREYGITFICLCLSNVIGESDPIDNGRIVTQIIHKILDEEEIVIYGDGGQKRDYIHVDDVVKIISLIIEKDIFDNTIYNISSGESVSVLDIISKVEKQLNKKAILKYEPFKKSELKEVALDNSRIINRLNLKITPFDKSLFRTVKRIERIRGIK